MKNHFSALFHRRFFKSKTISGSDHPAVKANIFSLFQFLPYIFLQCRHFGFSHFHQCDVASLQLFCRLNKIAAIRKQCRFVLQYHQRSRRTRKSAEIFANHKIFAHVFTVVIIRCGDDITVNISLFHGGLKCRQSLLYHVSSFFLFIVSFWV